MGSLFHVPTGTIDLPAGRFEIHSEIKLPDGAHDLTVRGAGTTLHAAADFQGRALLTCKNCRNLSILNLVLDGNRQVLEKPLALPPGNILFSRFYTNNGILIEDADGFRMEHVNFSNVANFPVIVSHSNNVLIAHVTVANSGSKNVKGRNNGSGGILLEHGTTNFVVADSELHNIRGNGIWTHAYHGTLRNLHGKIANNKLVDIGRDALQVGGASDVKVQGNSSRRIGFHFEEVDLETMATPVGIDTAGNVDNSSYEYNHFEEVDGKCIDLDGFHDGTVRGNTCINRGKAEDYPFGNFGISLNNTSDQMRSQNILIENNTIDGSKHGGIFVIGTGHRIVHNTLRHLNRVHCNDVQGKFACIQILDEPGFLESGIYLARRASRPDPANLITILDNTISGWKMAKYCIRAAPGVSIGNDKIQGNRCSDE